MGKVINMPFTGGELPSDVEHHITAPQEVWDALDDAEANERMARLGRRIVAVLWIGAMVSALAVGAVIGLRLP
jgi:hypothetical protein